MANNGSMVKVHYTGTLGDGTVFDSSLKREPLQFKLGCGHVIPGFEEAVLSMKVGETKTVTIPADQAYGQRREELILVVERRKCRLIWIESRNKLQMRQPKVPCNSSCNRDYRGNDNTGCQSCPGWKRPDFRAGTGGRASYLQPSAVCFQPVSFQTC